MALLDQIKGLRKFNFDDAYNTFLGLEKRQQVLVGVGAGIVLILLLSLPAMLFSSKLGEIEEDYLKYKKDADRLNQVLQEYSAIQKSLKQSRASSSSGSDSLSSLLYKEAEDLGIPKSRVSLKSLKLPKGDLFDQEGKDVEIRKVPYDQLMKLLNNVKYNKDFPIVINKLVLKVDRKNRQIINQASFSVATIQAK